MKIDRTYRKSTIPPQATCVFEGVIFDVYQWEQELYDGTKTTFEKLSRPDTALIYPVLPDGRILLIEDTQPVQQTYLCPPMGRVDPGESNEDAARRELLEETGYTVDKLIPLYEFEPHIKIDWMIYAYVGKGMKKVKEPDPGAGEKIIPHPVTFDEFIKLATAPDFDDPRFTTLALRAQQNPTELGAMRATFAP